MPTLRHLLEDLNNLSDEPDNVRLDAEEYDSVIKQVRSASEKEED